MSNTPSPAALRAAKALFPHGVMGYHYDTREENEAAMHRDWESKAHIIDREFSALRALNAESVAALTKSFNLLLKCESAIFALVKPGRENLSAAHIKEIEAIRHSAKDLALEEVQSVLTKAQEAPR